MQSFQNQILRRRAPFFVFLQSFFYVVHHLLSYGNQCFVLFRCHSVKNHLLDPS